MKKFCVEVRVEDIPALTDIVCDWFDGYIKILEPAYSQYCTRNIEVELHDYDLKNFYEMLKMRSIRNYKKEVA